MKKKEDLEVSDYASGSYFNHYQKMIMIKNKRKKMYKIFLPFILIFILTVFTVMFVYPHL